MLDNPKRASVVFKTRRKWLFVPILVRLSTGADPAAFNDSGSIKSSTPGFPRRLHDKNFLIVVAEVKPIFQERREDCADAGMTGLAEAVDNSFLVGEGCLAQLAERRQETGVGRRLGMRRTHATEDEQQHEWPLPAAPVGIHHL